MTVVDPAAAGVLAAALDAHDNGACVVRTRPGGGKRPDGLWKQHQVERPTRETVEAWLSNGHTGFGVITGKVSGNLEMFEFEGRAVDAGLVVRFTKAVEAAGLYDTWDRVVAGYLERTPSGGLHTFWRCDEIEGNQPLARRPATDDELAADPDDRTKTLIETRGEGGFTVCAPSHGTVHEDGGEWTLRQGGWSTIATITPAERSKLLEIAASFDELPEPEPYVPKEPTGRSTGGGSKPSDEFDATHTGDDVLTAAGFTFHSRTAHGPNAGTHYTRPGKDRRKGSSATVYDHGRTTLYSPNINAPTEFLPHGNTYRSLRPWQLHVALNHRGDFAAAARAWRDAHPRPPRDDWSFIGDIHDEPDDPEAPPTPAGLPDEFWQARTYLRHIRQAAHSRRRSAEAILHVVLARVAAITPHTIQIPAIVGSPKPLSYFVALIATPGTGKSDANAIGAELVPAPDWVVDQIPLGSGEGLAELLFEVVEEKNAETGKNEKFKKQTRHNVCIVVDEGQIFGEQGGRKGSTLLPSLRTIWTGGTLGQANANHERFRVVPAHSYVYGLVASFQATRAGDLLADADAGTPQRFGWASASDPTHPDLRPDWPGTLDWSPTNRRTSGQPLTVHPDIAAEIDAADLARQRGQVTVAPLDAHADLYRLKVAALLALLDGRRDVNPDDWALATTIKTASDAVRASVIATLDHVEHRRQEAVTRAHATREVAADVAKEKRRTIDCARKVAQKVHAEPDRWTVAELRRWMNRWRDVFDDALDHAIAESWVVEQTEPGQGDRKRVLRPGEVQP